MWSCCQRTTLPSDMKNIARFLYFHFTNYPQYQQDKTLLGTTKASKEVVLEKMHCPSMGERKTDKCSKISNKRTNTLKSEHV